MFVSFWPRPLARSNTRSPRFTDPKSFPGVGNFSYIWPHILSFVHHCCNRYLKVSTLLCLFLKQLFFFVQEGTILGQNKSYYSRKECYCYCSEKELIFC